MKLTDNFSSSEFKCKDGTEVPEELMPNLIELVKNLQVLRDFIGKKIIIVSGYRTKKYNTRCGGARNSQHLTASACDIMAEGHTPSQLKEIVEKLIKQGKLRFGGVGLYQTFLHVDIRNGKARWSGSGSKDS